MKDKTEQIHDKMIALIQRHPKRFIALIIVISIVWVVTNHRSDSFFVYEGISLGMTTKMAEQELPNAGKFRSIKIYDQASAKNFEFEILKAKEKPAPWSQMMVVAVDGKVVSISTFVYKISEEQVEELRDNVISLYGSPDDILESKFGTETLVWGNVDFDQKDIMQSVKKIHGRAIIFRSKTPEAEGKYKISGSAKLYISKDGEGPRLAL